MEEQTEQTGADEASGERGATVDGGAKATLESRSTGVCVPAEAGNVIEATDQLKAAMKPGRGSGDKEKGKGKDGGKKVSRTGTVRVDGEGRARAGTDGGTSRPRVDVVAVAREHDMWWLGEKNVYFMRSPVGRFSRGKSKAKGKGAAGAGAAGAADAAGVNGEGEGEGDAVVLPGRGEGEYMKLNQSGLVQWLELMGLYNGERNKPGEVQEMIGYLQACRQINAVLDIAGHREGVMVMPGRERVLVQHGTVLPEPVRGEWGLLRNLFEQGMDRRLEGPEVPKGWRVHVNHDAERRGREVWEAMTVSRALADDDGEVSWWYRGTLAFYSWLKLRLELLWRRTRKGEDVRRNGPVLVLIGPKNSYKSFIATEVIKPLFGGQSADPARYLSGETSFNGELVRAPLLKMGDSPLGTAPDQRRKLGEYFKHAVGEKDQRVEMKGLDAMGAVQPVWSYVWTLNDDQNNLQQMPPMVDTVVDKFLILHMNDVVLRDEGGGAVDTEELDDYMRFGRRVAEEVPAFLHYLLYEFEIPGALKGGRWGMVPVQAPELMVEMFEQSREGQLLEWLDFGRWEKGNRRMGFWDWVNSWTEAGSEWGQVVEEGNCWVGTHLELMAALRADEFSERDAVEQMFKKRGSLAMMLHRLRKDQPARVDRPGKDGRVHKGRDVERLWQVWRAGTGPSGAGSSTRGNN